jgi:hypothetical protein
MNSMAKKLIGLVAFIALLKVTVPGAAGQVPVAPPPASYPARSSAPAAIASGAEVLVLGPDGYTTAVKGGNGFVCLVERSWAKETNDPEFWNPKVSAPICVNAPAARTYLPIVLMKAKLVLAKKSKIEIGQAVKAALDSRELPSLEPNAMCYMMSKHQYLSDDDMHWHPHMMWFVPGDTVKSWGANQAGVPVYAGDVPEDRMTVFMVPVSRWSDGTPFSQPAH